MDAGMWSLTEKKHTSLLRQSLKIIIGLILEQLQRYVSGLESYIFNSSSGIVKDRQGIHPKALGYISSILN